MERAQKYVTSTHEIQVLRMYVTRTSLVFHLDSSFQGQIIFILEFFTYFTCEKCGNF